MKEKLLYGAWACLYILCVSLGTIQGADGIFKAALVIISLIFFIPGMILLYDGIATGDRKAVLRIRWISIASLVLTVAALVAFLISAAFLEEAAVNVFYDVLILVSSPMVCSQYWLLSLFLWASLLSATFVRFKK